MNIERNNTTENEVEYVEKIHNPHSKFKKFELLVFIGCLAFAFMMWCYANYIDDPIIKKEVTLDFRLDDQPGNGSVSSNPSTIVIYGEESILSGINKITVSVKREDFDEDRKITIEVKLPDDVYTHDDEIEIELAPSKQ